MKNYIQALKILKKGKIFIKDEITESSKSLNRVISENIYSKENYPSNDNSSFDGYIIKSSNTKNLSKKKPKFFKIIGSIAAGDKIKTRKIKKFQTMQIMTGGIIPKNFDTIIPNEKVTFYPDRENAKYILINKKIRKYQNIRFKGSDYKFNDLLIKKGTLIQSKHIMALKTLGIEKIKVKRVPNILFFSTGNEITDKKKISNLRVRNSNYHYIKSLKKNFLFNFNYGGILKDNDERIFEKKIKKAFLKNIDIIITSGAVSAGKFDFIPKVVKKFNLSNYFKSVSIKPGKPILFAKFKGKQKAFFGLPGNPISTAACFRFFVYPYLQNSLGLEIEKPIKARLKHNFKKKINLTNFLKSKINTTKDGIIKVTLLKGQESFKIQSFVNSNIWTMLPYGKSKLKKNEIVDCFFPNSPNKFF